MRLSFFRFLSDSLGALAWEGVLLPCVFLGGIYLSIGTGAVQLRHFGCAMKHTVGKVFRKAPARSGSVTPFQAVTTALAATVGTGNIIGTSQAIALGGYGAVFWMWAAALLGMVIKYAEVTLAVRFRERDARGDWVGGPMYTIKNGMGARWNWLACIFSLFAALAALGIGNMSQANAAADAVTDAVTLLCPGFTGAAALRRVLGVTLAALTALVLFGGIKRLGAVTERLVPCMSVLYIALALTVIFSDLSGVGRAFALILKGAFAPQAVLGAASGITLRQTLTWGLRRSAFSNEAGLGSAPIAHAAADCESAVEQGFFGIFEVFADTVVLCTLTALAIIVSGVPITFGVLPGASLVAAAFGTVLGAKLASLAVAVCLALFACSTIFGWALYGSRCAQFLFGERGAGIYRRIYVVFVAVGAAASADLVWSIADTLNGLMAIPNFIALFALSPVVFRLTRDYFRR